MKQIFVFLAAGAVLLTVGAYLSLKGEIKQDQIQNTGTSVSVNEKPHNHLDIAKNVSSNVERENMAALRDEVSHLKTEVLALRSDIKNSSNLGSTQEELNDLQTSHEIHAKAEKRIKKQVEVIESGFRQQTIDPVWSEKTKTLIQEALTKESLASKDIVDVDCRNSMCRVELTNEASGEELKLEELPINIGSELPNIIANHIKESDNSTTTVLYLSKENFVLPKANN